MSPDTRVKCWPRQVLWVWHWEVMVSRKDEAEDEDEARDRVGACVAPALGAIVYVTPRRPRESVSGAGAGRTGHAIGRFQCHSRREMQAVRVYVLPQCPCLKELEEYLMIFGARIRIICQGIEGVANQMSLGTCSVAELVGRH